MDTAEILARHAPQSAGHELAQVGDPTWSATIVNSRLLRISSEHPQHEVLDPRVA